MDTDDLSNELYKAIFYTVERFHHDLTLQFGVLASYCKDEPEYIEKAIQLINEFKKDADIVSDDIFFESKPSKEKFTNILDKILQNIEKVKQITLEKRHFDF